VIVVKPSGASAAISVFLIATSALAIEHKAYLLSDDFGMKSGYDCALQYYYFIPCPTYCWFWGFYGWEYGDIVGAWFKVGDMSMQGLAFCDPTNCHVLEGVRVVDMAAYGIYYPNAFAVQFDVYCCDEYGGPTGPSLWKSDRFNTGFGFSYMWIDTPVTICECAASPGPPPTSPRILVTATHVGHFPVYPSWGCDDISSALETGCELHDTGCLPALYPRPYVSYSPTIHSGYYGNDEVEYCPPLWFKDGRDTSPDGTQFGFVELAWRFYITCSGPTEAQSTTWGSIKSMYR
jgi:hypothetical protein